MIRKARYHIVTRLLVIAALVAALPLAIGFLLIQHSAKTRLSDAAGENYYWLAEAAASGVGISLVRELEFVSSVARSPTLVSELRDDRYGAASDYLAALAGSSLYRDFVLLDGQGAVLAGHALDEASLSESRRGLERLKRPRAVEAFAEVIDGGSGLALIRPVREPESNRLLGFLRAELDTERLFRSVSELRIGVTGHACLFDRESGRLLAGRRADCAEADVYARREELERATAQGARYFLAGAGGPASFDRGAGVLVGYARPGFSLTLPELDWIVAVEQSLAEAHAPLAPLYRELVTYFLGMGVLVLVLAAYMSYQLERPVADTAIDLHPERTPLDDVDVAEDV